MAIIMENKSATIRDVTGVGIRDLRDNLSRHLQAVKEGGEITVTEHGKPVARIVSYVEPTRIERMIAEGKITLPARPKDEPLPEPVEYTGKPLSEIVIEMRR